MLNALNIDLNSLFRNLNIICIEIFFDERFEVIKNITEIDRLKLKVRELEGKLARKKAEVEVFLLHVNQLRLEKDRAYAFINTFFLRLQEFTHRFYQSFSK